MRLVLPTRLLYLDGMAQVPSQVGRYLAEIGKRGGKAGTGKAKARTVGSAEMSRRMHKMWARRKRKTK